MNNSLGKVTTSPHLLVLSSEAAHYTHSSWSEEVSVSKWVWKTCSSPLKPKHKPEHLKNTILTPFPEGESQLNYIFFHKVKKYLL